MRRLLVLGILCVSASAFAQQPKLPDWFPAQTEFSVGGSVIHVDYGEETFKDAKGDHQKVRGEAWESGAYPTQAQSDAGTPWKGTPVFNAIVSGLKQQGFVAVYLDAAHLTASLRKGAGDGATYVWVSFSDLDSSSDQIAIVKAAPLTATLTLPPPAAPPEKVGDSQNLPYLPPMPGMTLTSTVHDQSPMDYEPATGDTIQPFGGSVTKRYDYSDRLSALEFGLVYSAALKRAGWTLGHTNVDQGLVYAHYDKNGRNIYLYARRDGFVVAEPPATVALALTPPASPARVFDDKTDFPYLTPLPGWTLAGTGHDTGPLVYYAGDGPADLVGSGAIEKSYRGESEDLSNGQFVDAYARALVKAGWTLGHRNDSQGLLYAHYDRNGRDVYIYLSRNEHPTFLVTDVGSSIKAALDNGCKVAVYGVNFDFNKATLRPEAEPVLQQVLALFTGDPQLSLEIGGHTDNVGTPAYNQTLSEKRAAAVRDWLVAHGVAASRLTSRGYGESQPLVPNDSDANRAKNRRVELKKPGCGS